MRAAGGESAPTPAPIFNPQRWVERARGLRNGQLWAVIRSYRGQALKGSP
jgi:hypothetical protein